MDVSKVEDTGEHNPRYVVTDPKFKNSKFYVQKSNDGFKFFEIAVSVGKVASAISGRFTTPEKALKALEDWLKVQKKSKSTRRDETYARNHGAAAKPNSKSDVQQGASN